MSGHDDSEGEGDARARGAMSRRALLAGSVSLGTVGALSGGASVLLLTERNVAQKNVLDGTEMDLRTAWREYGSKANSGSGASSQASASENPQATMMEEHGVCGGGFEKYAREGAPAIELNSVEPGDRGALVVCARCSPPAATVWARVRMVAAAEHGRGKAERAHSEDDEGDGPELPYHLKIMLRRPKSCEYEFKDGEYLRSGPLDRLDGTSVKLDGTAVAGESSPACLALEWYLPKSVPETVRSDSVSFTLEFAVAQNSRNGGSRNPWGGGQ